MAVFDSRVGYLSHEEGASLRRFRGIVVQAWSDIDAGLPDPFPPPLSANLLFFDGRDEGSKYPNFMLFSERVHSAL